jgi:hypothetical protein
MEGGKGMRRKFCVFGLLLLVLFFAGSACGAEEKFVWIYKDDGFDMYLHKGTLNKNKDEISCWVKSVYSEKGKAWVLKNMPSKYRKKPIEYGMDFFVLNTKTGKYQIKVSIVHSPNGDGIYREGSKAWLPVKQGTLAALIANKLPEELKNK